MVVIFALDTGANIYRASLPEEKEPGSKAGNAVLNALFAAWALALAMGWLT
jgi:hypothetical protein